MCLLCILCVSTAGVSQAIEQDVVNSRRNENRETHCVVGVDFCKTYTWRSCSWVSLFECKWSDLKAFVAINICVELSFLVQSSEYVVIQMTVFGTSIALLFSIQMIILRLSTQSSLRVNRHGTSGGLVVAVARYFTPKHLMNVRFEHAGFHFVVEIRLSSCVLTDL